jgi:hypothetical protein
MGNNKKSEWCGRGDLNPHSQRETDFKSAASTDSATPALFRLTTLIVAKGYISTANKSVHQAQKWIKSEISALFLGLSLISTTVLF